MLLDEDVVYDQYDPVAKLHYRITPKHVKEYEPIICSTYLSYDSLSRYKQKEGLERQMIAINQGNQNKMKAIRKRLEDDFKGFYGIDPDQLDMKAVALLNSGVLNRSDLSQMAEKYADNVGMLRLIGKEAKKYGNERDMQLLAAKCSLDKPSVHLEKFDGFSSWTHVGLGGDNNGNIGYARFAQTFDDKLNERLDGFMASLPDVVRCSDSEHGVWYTSENN